MFSERSSPAAMALRNLLDNHLHRAMQQLIDAVPADVPAVQGEARVLRRILKYLTDAPQHVDNAPD